MTSSSRALCLADFNAENLATILRASHAAESVEVAPYGQVATLLADRSAPCWTSRWDFVVVWTRPEAVLPSFHKMLHEQGWSETELEREIEAFATLLQTAQSCADYVFVPMWINAVAERGRGLRDLGRSGITRTLWKSNLILLEKLEPQQQIIPLNTERWVQAAGEKAYSPRLWYQGKIPFSSNVFSAAADEIKAALRSLKGLSRKIVILDLDGTLWDGLVGEDGWEKLRLGGHDAAGEALVDFQRELKALRQQGILLAIVSKNEEAAALEAIDSHPEMVLRREDFAAWRINWKDKADNVADLMAELNLGMQAAVFIDDNPVERDRIRHAFPDLLVPEWPEDKRFYPTALFKLRCFDNVALTSEDRERTEMYRAEQRRAAARREVSSPEEWLQELGTQVTVGRLERSNLSRAAQLLNKTNQMNLTSRRLPEAQLLQWAEAEKRVCFTFRVQDKFGDAGLVGLLSLEGSGAEAQIVDFILSCRVIGRQIEDAMLYTAAAWAQEAGYALLTARHLPTPRNNPCLEYFKRSPMSDDGSGLFSWTLACEYPRPTAVVLGGNVNVETALSEHRA